MACVLTLAAIADDKVIVGHVGDSRLYLTWNGAIRKLTSDHSPVGEREDAGELNEAEAMAHPRRHEVFRDVGSRLREPDEEDFIEVKEFLFKPDAAILLCSDGLSDLLTSAEMLDVIERYNGDPAQVARRAGGGRAIWPAGTTTSPLSSWQAANSWATRRPRRRRRERGMPITRARDEAVEEPQAPASKVGRVSTTRVAFLIYGFVLGVAALALAWLRWPKP